MTRGFSFGSIFFNPGACHAVINGSSWSLSEMCQALGCVTCPRALYLYAEKATLVFPSEVSKAGL